MTGTSSGSVSSSSALQPIEQYTEILRPKNNASFVHTVLHKALSDPRVYVGFTELRSIPSVVTALQESPSGKAILNTLDLFSYGTYREYASMSEGKYISLTAPQLEKLKALTVVTIVQQRCDEDSTKSVPTVAVRSSRRNRRDHQTACAPLPSSSCRIIPYTVLQSELDIMEEVEASGDDSDNRSNRKPSIRPLEDLLIRCIYSHLLPSGTKLDQRNMSLVINLSSQSTSSSASNLESNHVLCRDVNVETDVTDMISKLEIFYEKGKERILVLNRCVEKLNQDAVNDGKKWRNIEKNINETKDNVSLNLETSGNDNAMQMLLEGGVVGSAVSMSSLSSTGRSARQVKRSRGGLRGTGVGRM